MERRVVITGIGIVSPVGIGKNPFWGALVEGRSGISKITQFDPSNFASQIAGEVKNFIPPSFIALKDLHKIPRFVQFALQATDEAIKDSLIDLSRFDPYRIGVIVGSGIGGLHIMEEQFEVYFKKGPNRLSPFLIPGLITNEAAGNIAIYFHLKGVNFCPVTACATSSHAIGEAYLSIKYNRLDVVICGGTEAAITPLGVGGFCALRALSKRNHEPQKASRPFDKDRDGFVMAEGAGIVILEELNSALKRNAPIYGEVLGYGATCDAYHITAPSPDAEAPSKAIELAILESKVDLDREKIYINAHGTSTELNDKIETLAIKKVFKEKAKDLYINSTKSMTGHTLGAAGAIEFIVCCLTLKHKIIHPTINYETPDPECDLNYTPNKAIERNVTLALSNSFGFGGHNATLLIKEFK